MNSQSGVRRVIIVVLDGLRPDAIDAFDLLMKGIGARVNTRST